MTQNRIGVGALALLLVVAAEGRMAAAAGAPAATSGPPIDGAGAYVHAVTLRPARLGPAAPPEPPLRIFGQAVGPDGALHLLAQGERLVVDGAGRVRRETYGDEASLWFGFYLGGLATEDGLTLCDQAAGGLRVVPPGGPARVVPLRGVELSGVCVPYRASDDGVLVAQLNPPRGWHVAPDGTERAGAPLDYAAWAKGDAGILPCGADARGRPLALVVESRPDDRQAVTLSRLDDRFRPTETVWRIDTSAEDADPNTRGVDFRHVDRCGFAGDHTWLWGHQGILVFEGGRLLSALRNGAPLELGTRAVGGAGPYAFEVLGAVALLDDGRLLVAAERDNGRINLYVRRDAALDFARPAPADDRAAAAVRIEALVAAGWWEDARRDADAFLRAGGPEDDARQRVGRAAARARGRQLLTWAARLPDRPGAVSVGPVQVSPGQQAAALLAEAVALAAAHPDVAEPSIAQIRLARFLGRRAVYREALGRLAALERAGAVQGADVPELFDWYAAHGDIDRMAALVAAMGPGVAAAERAVAEARLLRARGAPAEALARLEKLAGDDAPAEALLWKARLQVETGAVEAGILTWTRARSRGLRDDPRAAAGLGAAYLRRGLVELAVESLLEAVNADPEEAAWRSNLALAYAALDRRSDALKQVYAALAEAPEDPLLRFQMEELTGAARPAPTALSDPGEGAAVAVLPLVTAGGSRERLGMGPMLAAMLVSVIVENHGPTVVERRRIDAVLAEQELQQGAHVDPETAVRIGKLVGARRLVTGVAAEFDDALQIDLHVIDVETGRVLAAAHGTAALDLDALRALTLRLAAETLQFTPRASP